MYQNWCFLTVVLDKTLESPLNCKEIQQVKGNQSWTFFGTTDAKAEAPVLWPPDVKNWLIRKDPDAGKNWRQMEKGTKEDKDGWMTSPNQWTWIWASSGSWSWTGKPDVLQSMGSQSQTWLSDWTELRYRCSWTNIYFMPFKNFIKAFKAILHFILQLWSQIMFALSIYIWNLVKSWIWLKDWNFYTLTLQTLKAIEQTPFVISFL